MLPAITTLSSGSFVVTWQSDEFRIFNADGTAAGPLIQMPPPPSGIYRSQHEITALKSGGFVITWSDNSITGEDAPFSNVKAQIYDATGATVGGEFLVNTVTAGIQIAPQITSLASGGFVVAWIESGGRAGDHDIKAQVFDAAGVKVGSEFLVHTATLNNQASPALASLP